MSLRNTQDRYGSLSIGLHWLMLAMRVAGWLLLSAAGKPIPFFGLHAAALYHHYIVHDNTLLRMLPKR